MNDPPADNTTIGLLYGGGIDSSVLAFDLLRQGKRVQPFYIRCGLVWEEGELAAGRAFLKAIASPRLDVLVTLDMPVEDVYANHWSQTGKNTPGYTTPDEAVYLPGRNPLLLIKPLIWCQMHGIGELALATLATNPFPDATDEFFESFTVAMSIAGKQPVKISRPYAEMHKDEVMRRGAECPLELTFSCISPEKGLHCDRCNKCAERQAAFRMMKRG